MACGCICGRKSKIKRGEKMETLENQKEKSYGVFFAKSQKCLTITEQYQHNGLTVTLPLGELMLTVMEALETMQSILNGTAEKDKALQSFFENREYNLSFLFDDFAFNRDEEKRLLKISDFVFHTACSQLTFSAAALRDLFYSVFPRGHNFLWLLDSTEKYRVRQLHSKLPLPFGSSTESICQNLGEQYDSYSFFTVVEIQTLTELCAVSLFEILESGQFVHSCRSCKRLFVAKPFRSFLCNRPSPFNEHKGCKKTSVAAFSKQYRETDVLREYKRVYNRLQARATRPNQPKSSVLNFETFKREWSLLKINCKHLPEYKEKQMEFLQSERWK